MGSESEVPKGTWAIDTNRKERNALINDLTHYSIGGDRLINLHKQSYQVQNISDSENSGAKWNNYDCLATGILVKTFDLIKKTEYTCFISFIKDIMTSGNRMIWNYAHKTSNSTFRTLKKYSQKKKRNTVMHAQEKAIRPVTSRLIKWLKLWQTFFSQSCIHSNNLQVLYLDNILPTPPSLTLQLHHSTLSTLLLPFPSLPCVSQL